MATALQQVKAMAMRPLPSVPAPARPREEWVLALVIFREDDRAPLVILPGERPPADIRSDP